MKLDGETKSALVALETVLNRYTRRYTAHPPARDFGTYLSAPQRGDDEETLTEPILADVLEQVLGFPTDAYFPQLSKAGSKPDFTPSDLVAHPFVLDAKSSAISDLDAHEAQIRRYIDQRGLRFGVLFNLREVRVYVRGAKGHEPSLSFRLLPLWQVVRGEALPSVDVDHFRAFVNRCRHRAYDLQERIGMVRRADPWRQREAQGERPTIDVEYLVDRLRALSRLLADDAAAAQGDLDRALRLDPELESGLLAELYTLANDLEPGVDPDDLPESVAAFRVERGLPARVWHQYLLRVSQLALVRVLLYRSWEDAGFVDERLYDGGFGRVYDRLGHRVSEVLEEAFSAGRDRYPWLYGAATTYDWYRPSPDALVEILYTLLPVPLGKLDADVLGGLYESYVDEIDRDRLGQFYTPRSVVRFMLDRAGFTTEKSLFEVEGNARRPHTVLDFATGSGGFLVEAARRIVDEVVEGDVRSLEEGLGAITNGLHGSEISPFPYYLTEVNLLLQVSRVLGRMRQQNEPLPRNLHLAVVHADTLEIRRGPNALKGLEEGERRTVTEDRRFGLVPLDRAKAAAYGRIAEPGSFQFVVGNPPYVFESGNRALFERLRRLPGWKDIYRGKGDYLYYFLTLASEALAPGGRLAVIVPAGWMNAGEADWLRERLATTLRLDELFLFGSYRLFAPEMEDVRDRRRAQSPTVESAILIATKAEAPPQHELRVTALENERATARVLHGPQSSRPDRDALLAEMARRADAGRGGRRAGIFVHSVRQASLRHSEPWPVKFGPRDLATRVVAHLDAQLAGGGDVEPLGERWHIFQGVQTGADAYTARIQKRLDRSDRDALAAAGRQTGEPIMELPAGREREAPWRDVPQLLARSVESHAILYGALDEDDYTHLVWIGREDEAPDAVPEALEPWRRVLATRAEFVRNPRRRWFETAWPRDKEQLCRPKVIALYRTDRGRFAVDAAGEWQPSIKTTLCTAKADELSVTYLCGLLNAELLDLWYAVRGKTPWHVRRNYEPKPMARIPYRHVDLTGAASEPSVRLEALDALLATAPTDPDLGHALEAVVRALADNRRALLPFRAFAPALTSTVKDPWRTEPPELDPSALLNGMPAADTISLRIDPALTATIHFEGPLGRPILDGGKLAFRRARRVTAEVTGPAERLALLERLIGPSSLETSQLDDVLLPKDDATFEALQIARADEIQAVLDHGRELVERAERLVCRLYRVPEELEDEVIAHAVERARRGEPGDED